ncbi:hypothetical protein BO83DRAFT_395824 [Aspergillus eucalypticola CBS 122712]|uniref:Uncharacterized protein n=1 Tax=Aspergillus eucalypticola (strain CBS 122712 / IBT 29274) TaxID=1448314 RepID=A0A317WEW9_ASPEC|nr:uncharacterized protein BO83DRAFT_395824 [Aspergillus eucalypticola CBS 122712]PWY82770.1 hypothetical protein BO83DRAFT_395824 [Aspergillus eucalypticola CBS 122712]
MLWNQASASQAPGRWLSTRRRDPQHLAARYCEFNLDNLLVAANQLTGYKGVSKCVKGQYNKGFVLTMDNGEQIVARLPNPNVGPAFFTTASEVASRHFMPGPRVLGHSGPAHLCLVYRQVEPRYSLGSIWARMCRSSQFVIIDQVVEIEGKLASVLFPMQGCLYYTSDLKSNIPEAEGLDITPSKPSGLKIELCRQLSCFAIGPSNDRKLWNSERNLRKLDRGPWTSPIHYVTALGTNELNWARHHAKPRMNYYRSTETPENLNEDILNIARNLVPKQACCEYDYINTLSYPDLHLDNIFHRP